MMKKLLLYWIFISIVVISSAQVPQAISYQAVARDLSGNILSNKNVSLRISIVKDNNAVYVETHSATTNQFGLLNLQIGKGTPVAGMFSSIDWGGTCFAKVEIDVNGGANFQEIATSQILAVPYALYAEKVKSLDLVAGPGISLNGKTISSKVNLIAGDGISISGSYPNLTVSTNSSTRILPRSAVRGQLLTVNFSGGPELTFQQGSATCPALYPLVYFRQSSSTQGSSTQGSSTQGSSTQGSSTQGSSTLPDNSIIIYPVGLYLIDSKTLEATFDIPSYIPGGFYDIIFGGYGQCQKTIPSGFKIH